jgi:hypothetical protein
VARRFAGAELAAANSAYVLAYGAGQLAGPPIAGAAFTGGGTLGFLTALAGFSALYAAALLLGRRSD